MHRLFNLYDSNYGCIILITNGGIHINFFRSVAKGNLLDFGCMIDFFSKSKVYLIIYTSLLSKKAFTYN